MTDDPFEPDEFEWDLQSSKVSKADKLLIPESLRDEVCMDSGEDDVTWWCYDENKGRAFLSSGYSSGDKYSVVNGRNYKLEKNSRVIIPKPKDSSVTEGVLGNRPKNGDTVYFYTDSRLLGGSPRTVFVLSKEQMNGLMRRFQIEIYENRLEDLDYFGEYLTNGLVDTSSYGDESEGESEKRKRSLAKEPDSSDSESKERILKKEFPVPQ